MKIVFKGRMMRTINGAAGEGGGQIFRTTLTLAMCLGLDVRIVNIRAGRKKPGLLRQHLTCLRAAQTICSADVSGDELGSQEVIFKPGNVIPGDYEFSVGSAGSTSLVLQTIMMPLLLQSHASSVIINGGTHNSKAPSFEFLNNSFILAVRKMGYQITAELLKYGFNPAGGGAIKMELKPHKVLEPLQLLDSGALVDKKANAIGSQIPQQVLVRELRQLQQQHHWLPEECSEQLVESTGPGNLLSLKLTMENTTLVFDELGGRGLRAEKVANLAEQRVQSYLKNQVPVCEYLADQLLLPMLFAGGSFKTGRPSLHTTTNINVIQQLLDLNIEVNQLNKRCWQLDIPPLKNLQELIN
ncbi:MAG: RNA 3'-terminal phosphate cyclase (ATP) [Oleispira sp.]